MRPPGTPSASDRYTTLSDRFRSLWTFYQFLAGVLKQLGDGPLRYRYDFQGLHRRLQALVHRVGVEPDGSALPELEQIDRELDRIHRELARIDALYPPSVLRGFFDHIKRQDDKVLCALTKFYLLHRRFDQDTLDKLDILCTRLAEMPGEDRAPLPRGLPDLVDDFRRLADFASLQPLPEAETKPLEDAVAAIRREIEGIADYDALIATQTYDRYRRLKQRLGKNVLQPPLLAAITTTNIVAKARFQALLRAEEAKLLRDSDRIRDIESSIARHPELAAGGISVRLEELRHFRTRYESGRRAGNLKRNDIADLVRSMREVIARFDATVKQLDGPASGEVATGGRLPEGSIGGDAGARASAEAESDGAEPGASRVAPLSEVLPSDPLLSEVLHRMTSALEPVVWNRPAAQAVETAEVRSLALEPWEAAAYRWLADNRPEASSSRGELQRFFLTSAALRIKMTEERAAIRRLEGLGASEPLVEMLERSAQSLERAGEEEGRFRQFIDDMMPGGDAGELEQLYRSRFRFLNIYSGLWLDHQRAGGLTPLS